MNPKQLPDDLCDWFTAQTFVIGAVTSLESTARRLVRRVTDERKKPDRQPFTMSDGIRKQIKFGGPRPALPCDAEEPLTAAQRLRLVRKRLESASRLLRNA